MEKRELDRGMRAGYWYNTSWDARKETLSVKRREHTMPFLEFQYSCGEVPHGKNSCPEVAVHWNDREC